MRDDRHAVDRLSNRFSCQPLLHSSLLPSPFCSQWCPLAHGARLIPLHIPNWCTMICPTRPSLVPVVPLAQGAVSPFAVGLVMLRPPSVRAVGLAAALLASSTPALAQRDGGQPDSLYTR